MYDHVCTVFYDDKAKGNGWQIVIKVEKNDCTIAQGFPANRATNFEDAKALAEKLIKVKHPKWEEGRNPWHGTQYARCDFRKRKPLC